MTLQQFLNSKNFNSEINQILLNIESGSMKMYRKLNEETADIFGSSGQTLSLRHDTLSRECYIPAISMSLKNISKIKGLVNGLETILDLK